jgi:EmrB/QacA subfamily drug resistance transporter
MEITTAYRRRWWALGVLSLSLVVIGMDNTILNVALPTLVRDLGASASQLQWVVDAYILVFAGLLLSMGSLGDRFGRKLALDVGLVVFAVGSTTSAFAGSAEVLIGARAFMGIGGALIMPSTLSIITNTFTGRERGRAIGVWAALAGLGIVLGPVVGGWLLERFWWGSVFLVNVPVVIVALLLGWKLVPESKDPSATPLDPVGAALSIAGLISLVYGIIEAPSNGWTDPVTLACFGAAAVLLGAFVAWELRVDHPMLRMSFFRDRRFTFGATSIMFASFALLGAIFVLTQYLQFVRGYTPLEAGIRVLPIGALIVGAPLSARLVEKVGSRAVVGVGLVIVAAGLGVLASADADSSYAVVATALALFGFGMGTTIAPATDAVMGSLPLAKAGVGSAMNDTTRLVGGALGVAVVGSVLASAYTSSIDPALAGLPGQAADAARDSIGAALGVAAQLGSAGVSVADAARSSFVDAMATSVLVAAGVAFAGALLALLFLPARAARPALPPTEPDRRTTSSPPPETTALETTDARG